MLNFILGFATCAILIAAVLIAWREIADPEPPEYDSVRDRFERECG